MGESLRRFVRPLRRRDGDDCRLCWQPINFALRPPDLMAVSVDHLVPRSLGGRTIMANLRLSHFRCNNDRGAGWNRRRKRAARSPEPGEVPASVCWDDWSAARR